MQVSMFMGLGGLPLFNPDLEAQPPSAVQDFRRVVGQADALLIASPEYAHGISGAMKNALDWLVSFEGVVYKPIALVNTSPRAHHADAALREVLKTMSTVLVADASIALPLLGGCITEEAMLESAPAREAISASLAALATHLAGPAESAANFPLAC